MTVVRITRIPVEAAEAVIKSEVAIKPTKSSIETSALKSAGGEILQPCSAESTSTQPNKSTAAESTPVESTTEANSVGTTTKSTSVGTTTDSAAASQRFVTRVN